MMRMALALIRRVSGDRDKTRALFGRRQGLIKLFVYLFAIVALTDVSFVNAAHRVHARFERILHPQFSGESLDLELLPAGTEQSALLRLRVAHLRIGAFKQTLREVEFECEPRPLAATEADGNSEDPSAEPLATDRVSSKESSMWRCEGPLRWRGGATGWQLAWRADDALTRADIRLVQGNSEVELMLPLGNSPLAVTARNMRATWLQPLLPKLAWQAGRIDGRVELTDNSGTPSRWRGELRASGVSAEASAGAIALAGVSLAGPVELRTQAGGRLSIATTPTLSAGELLAGPVYLAWPAGSDVRLDVAVDQRGEIWQFQHFKLQDAGFNAEATATIQPGADTWLRHLSGTFEIDLATRYERYLEGAMASLGHAGLRTGGVMSGSIELGVGGHVQAFDARLDQVALRHPNNRYALTGLAGNLAFRRADQPPVPIDLRWQGLSVHELAFDPGMLKAASSAGEIRATEPLRLGLFGGHVIANDLVYRPLTATADRLQASVELVGINIAALVAAFDWPAFTGRLDGQLPDLRYAGDTLSAGGEIGMQVFDGEVRIAELAIERPFGVAPALASEVVLDNLNLQPMTEVFGLGRIEGRLNGTIAGLRLLDWQPTAFDANLRTAEKGRRRISQLAVEQLTQIGGGGGAAGVQGRLLGIFDSFGYRRIGLSCRLANNVCEMGGIDESAGGYTILQGSGLPLITIRGFQKRVDWPVLVQRLQSVASGQAPVVE